MKLFLCPGCLKVWNSINMEETEGICPDFGNDIHPCEWEDVIEAWTSHQYMAYVFQQAGRGGMSVKWEDLETYLGIKEQETFFYYGRRVRVDRDWESFCAYVYYMVTGESHPGSSYQGGFRSQEFGEIVAKAIREAGNEAG